MDFRARFTEIASKIGDNDEILELLRNIADDVEAAVNADENIPDGYSSWDEAYTSVVNERDSIKNKYIERFMNAGKADEEENDEEEENESEELKTYDSLFKEEK